MSKERMSERDIEILSTIVESWIDDGMKMTGDVSYSAVIELLNRLGVDPSRITTELREITEIGERLKATRLHSHVALEAGLTPRQASRYMAVSQSIPR